MLEMENDRFRVTPGNLSEWIRPEKEMIINQDFKTRELSLAKPLERK